MLGHSEAPLSSHYDLVMLDLDGVVYVGADAVPGAPAHLARARDAGLRCAFITNNASRTPVTVAEHLVALHVPAAADDVVTSAQAAARLLAEQLPPSTPVAVLGAAALAVEVEQAGLVPVGVQEPGAGAVVSGYGPDVLWQDVMRAAVLIRDGLWWVATNADRTIPTEYGVAPGHGVLVETVSRFTGVSPVVAGKPERPLLDETVRRLGGERPLMVGDRLDTDIAGAANARVDSLLVLTGVTGLTELVRAGPDERPTYLAVDLGGLLEPQPTVARAADGTAVGGWRVGGWRVGVRDDDRIDIEGDGSPDDWWRAVATASWAHLDRTGQPVATDGVDPPATSARQGDRDR